MSTRDNYQVAFRASAQISPEDNMDVLDNEIEFNANQFKLFDDFTTDLRLNYSAVRRQFSEMPRPVNTSRRGPDPDDSGVDMENGNPMDDGSTSKDSDLLENEVMVDPWSSMDSSNSPLTDSGPSASEDCTPSTSSDVPPPGAQRASSPVFRDPHGPPHDARRLPPESKHEKPDNLTNLPHKTTDRTRSRDLRLQLETEAETRSRRPHFLDEDYHLPSKSNIECRIPKPHFLDSPSPDEVDERSDITNPNFLDDIDGDDGAQKAAGTLPKRPPKVQPSYSNQEDKPYRTDFRSTLQYRLDNTARSSEREKRTSQLYTGTWPGDRDVWIGHDSASVRSFSSNGSGDGMRPSSNLENKMECVCSLISLLTLSPENNADLSGPLLEMSRSVESCIAMRQAGCIPLLVQLIHSKVPRETRDRAAKALRNIIHTQTDDKAGRREARVWKLLEQVREYCYVLEDVVEARNEEKDIIEDDTTKHPSQSVAALMKLSFDEEHRHVVCQLGGLQALAALVSGDQAAHGSRTDDNTCLTMRKYAGMTLTNLTFGDGNNKSLLCSFKDFMLALVEQLESPNDDMRQVTAAVLRNLSWRADTNSKQVLREVGAVKGLTKAAMTCQKEATLKSVLSALWNLTAHCSMNKVALCSVDGALGFLVDMLSYDSPSKTLAIVENAGGIMRNVSSHIAVREDYRQILRERNCLSVLLQHLKSPSLTVVSNSCGTLWNLSARCPRDQQFLWERGAVPMLRSLIHSKHKMIAMGSGAALKNLLNSKPGKAHMVSLDTTARNMNLPALPTLGARKQKLEQELDQNLAETCDNIEPATSPTTSHRDEKNLFTATERHIAMNLERHRMTASSPLMGSRPAPGALSHSAHLAGYLACRVGRSDSKDSVTSAHSDSVLERALRPGKVPVPTPRSRGLVRAEPPAPPPRAACARAGFDADRDAEHDACEQPVDYGRQFAESKPAPAARKGGKKDGFGDYQETDLDQPTDYSLRYSEARSGSESDAGSAGSAGDCVRTFATEGTPHAASLWDLSGRRAARDAGDDAERPVRYATEDTPAEFSRRSSLSSLAGPPPAPAQPTAPRAAPAGGLLVDFAAAMPTPAKDKEASKAVTFATAASAEPTSPGSLASPGASGGTPASGGSPGAAGGSPAAPHKSVEDTPLMFSRSSSLGSLPDCGASRDHATPVSEISRLTSGCISPSDIPDSPGHSLPASPPARRRAASPGESEAAGTPGSSAAPGSTAARAALSAATSLSSLTLLVDRQQRIRLISKAPQEGPPAQRPAARNRLPVQELTSNINNEPLKNGALDCCRVYCTEDTPALSKAGSHSDLSALSVLSAVSGGSTRAAPSAPAPVVAPGSNDPAGSDPVESDLGGSDPGGSDPADSDPASSDSSALSDGGDLLEMCIQRGIEKVVKNKGASDATSAFTTSDDYPPPARPPRPAPAAPPSG